MRRFSVSVDNKSISVIEGFKVPIFYIHGSGGDAEIWKNQLEEIGGYAIDLPNHGHSEKADIRTMDDYAYFVAEIVKKVAGKGIVVGHSLGGAIAQKVYLNQKEVVKALVLAGTGARLRVLPSVLEGLKNNPLETAKLVADVAFYRKEFVEQFSKLFEERTEILLKDLQLCDAFDLLNDFKVGRVKFDVPTLALVGEKDFLTPLKYSEFFTQYGAELKVISNSGHMVMLENPNEFNAELKKFISHLKSI
ncbi:MAG: alpha/beta hydrolase [Archaeoglobaceae archaeon]|nr:alpha/beta hydrolase [Archaeoglobaceae archaeon]MDW8118031.1 alpha/beta hydrolase [Archaeoglobaceae archaeon]